MRKSNPRPEDGGQDEGRRTEGGGRRTEDVSALGMADMGVFGYDFRFNDKKAK